MITNSPMQPAGEPPDGGTDRASATPTGPAASTGSVAPTGPAGHAVLDQPAGRLAPMVVALVAALDAIDQPGGSGSGSGAWGTSGLGVEQVSEADIDALARQHHRLTAQIGRLIRGPVTTGPAPGPGNAGPLVPLDPTDPAGVEPAPAPDPGSPSPDPNPAGDADGDRAAVPFGAQTALVRRGWRPGQARTVITAARFASRYPGLDQMWRAGDISAETVFTLAMTCKKLTSEQEGSFMTVILDHLHDLTHPQIRRLTARVLDLVRPDSTDTDESNAHADRSLTFSTLGDTVMFSGQLPKLEGQAFQDTIAAIAEQQRAEADNLTAGQRNADALTELIINSARTGNTPTLGGLPVAVTLTLSAETANNITTGNSSGGADGDTDVNAGPDQRATYPNGDIAATATTRFALCCAETTPITCTTRTRNNGNTGNRNGNGNAGNGGNADGAIGASGADGAGPARPGSFLDRLQRSPLLPLAVGRTQRLATPAQRKALAVRDGGCIIPGCDIPPNQTQPHHVTDYHLGGPTDLDNLASLCWVHHRQVDHHHWQLIPNPDPGTGPCWIAQRNPGHRR